MLYLGIDQHRKQLTVNVRDEVLPVCATPVQERVLPAGGAGVPHPTTT